MTTSISLPPRCRLDLDTVFVEDVTVGDRLRRIDAAKVAILAESMKTLGLVNPITVWSPNDSEVILIAGAHRLEAARSLGWESIPCAFVNLTENRRRRWEIAENLHRVDLTALERDKHRAEWIRLTDEDEKLAQIAPVSRKGGRGKKGGINAAVRQLGIDRTAAQRAVKVASLAPEAQQVACEIGLDDNRSALLSAAKHDTGEEQVAELKRQASARAARKARETTEVKDTKADARDILANAIVNNVPEADLQEVTAALAILGLREVAARIQALTGAVFDSTPAGRDAGSRTAA